MTKTPLTFLITGASSGFGLATAETLLGNGHKVILVARRGQRLSELASNRPEAVHTATLDITDSSAVSRFFASLPPEFTDIDGLINNAGIAVGMNKVQDSDIDGWDRMVATNITGLLHVTHGVLPRLRAKNRGIIVNIGSVAGHLPYPAGNVYGATKAFVRQFSRNLRADLLGTGIKVTNIEPGMAETAFSIVRLGDNKKAKAVYDGMTPLAAADIARTIAWVIEQPPHVNIDNIEIWPLHQTYGSPAVHRG